MLNLVTITSALVNFKLSNLPSVVITSMRTRLKSKSIVIFYINTNATTIVVNMHT